MNDVAVDISEAAVDAVLTDGEAFVIDAHEVEDGGVEVVEVDGFVFGVVAVVVGRAVNGAWFDTAASHEHGEAVWIVVAAVFTLGGWSASEFAAPKNEGFVEKAALF